jgi:hypothetical protein
MTKPLTVTSPGIFIPEDVSSVLAPPLERGLAKATSVPLAPTLGWFRRRLPLILEVDEVDALKAALRTDRDRAMTMRCCWAACAAARC